MLIGILVQLGEFRRALVQMQMSDGLSVSIIIYSLIATEFLIRHKKDNPFRADVTPRMIRTKKIDWMVYALRIATVCLFIR